MLLWILLLILVIVIFGLGFVVKWLFYVAIALFIIWLIMLLVNRSRA
ncbi:MAG TPA: hydrophobic protein [Thermoleophilia bacterium]|nr:hydrophobic protein [Thermoleophilia bacterium]